MQFKLHSDFKPTGDQPQAIEKLVKGVQKGMKHQVLLGVTGSGKTFTIASVIEELQKPTLVISHNKTLAAQLYQEFRDFFPKNAVSYFVSYYDYYQPEAYIPQTDTYIEKETDINELIDKLRLQATTNLLTRKDVIVVASVSCIYNLGSPRQYSHFTFKIEKGQKVNRQDILRGLTKLQYERSDYGFHRGTFRVRGEVVDVFPAYEDIAVRIELSGDKVKKFTKIDPLTGKILNSQFPICDLVVIYPAKHYIADTSSQEEVFKQIEKDLKKEAKDFRRKGKLLEAQRLESRVKYDIEMIKEIGYVNGIENYSRYFDGRKEGEPPYTLLDYFREPYGDDWLLVIDESHMSLPQISGMYNGDRSRKETLVEFGFRLKAAFDNRPLRFDEFLRRIPQTIYTSATPSSWEISQAKKEASRLEEEAHHRGVVEQLIRPTGIADPKIIIKKTENQIENLISEIEKRVQKGQRALVTTLTKRMAEALASFLKDKSLKVHYLHSEIDTLDRSDILDDLRNGKYDVLVGINLLREGLDLPEVSLVAILDADKEGFLRSETSLIQTMGRAARHIEGEVIMYADKVTGSIKKAVDEVRRRRKIQLEYNKKHHIKPYSIKKPIREKLIEREAYLDENTLMVPPGSIFEELEKLDINQLLPEEKEKLVKRLQKEMRMAASELNFELAAEIRDMIQEIKTKNQTSSL